MGSDSVIVFVLSLLFRMWSSRVIWQGLRQYRICRALGRATARNDREMGIADKTADVWRDNEEDVYPVVDVFDVLGFDFAASWAVQCSDKA